MDLLKTLIISSACGLFGISSAYATENNLPIFGNIIFENATSCTYQLDHQDIAPKNKTSINADIIKKNPKFVVKNGVDCDSNKIGQLKIENQTNCELDLAPSGTQMLSNTTTKFTNKDLINQKFFVRKKNGEFSPFACVPPKK